MWGDRVGNDKGWLEEILQVYIPTHRDEAAMNGAPGLLCGQRNRGRRGR